MPLVEERGFSFDLDLLRSKITNRTKLLILNSPQNPTGGVIPREDIAAHRGAGARSRHDGPVRRDLLAHRYGETPMSIASCPGMLEKTIILDGFSKIYAMTGWRMGYGVMPAWLADAVNKLMVNSNSCTASFTQRAGIAAITGPQDEPERMVQEFRRRRDAFVAGLNTIPGFRCRVAGRRVLRVSEYQGYRLVIARTGRSSAE